MNYSNMIEEKNLKKTFIIATLCSTLIGTFTSSIGLWDKVKDRRQQQRRDTSQDDKIKQIEARLEDSEKRSRARSMSMGRRPRDRSVESSRSGHRGSDHRGSDRDEVGDSFQRSGALISREFEDGYERLGRKFAVGDVLTENKLQAQVIALQQTVINVLQDALSNGRQLDRRDMAKLVAASDAARDGSLNALRQQRHRLLMATGEGSQSSHSPPQSLVSQPPAKPQLALGPPKRASTIIESDPLFCRYSLDLQYIRNKPLVTSFAPGGECICPACDMRVPAESNDYWVIGKRMVRYVGEGRYERQVEEAVEFHLGQRFIVKSHTPDGEFACVLCSRLRGGDTVCPTVDILIDHVGQAHDISELEQEPDFTIKTKPVPKQIAYR
ncbi:hypothetical protein G7046_g562 [Stylonectria norvegica]|nr:hypothetical protein G7046_g562 [Stylonectria norvegica]